MSNSSCQKLSKQKLEEIKAEREVQILLKAKQFLHQIAINMNLPEGVSGSLDLAAGVKRMPLITKAMREVADEIEEGKTFYSSQNSGQ